MNLSQMRIMRELAGRGTIAAVARHLHVTAPAISQQLAALHRELGVALTYRVGREIRLTEAGMALAEMAGTVHTLIDRAAETVREYGGDTGARVRVAAFQSAGQALLPGLSSGVESAAAAPALVFGEHDVAQPEFAELVDQYDLVIAHRMDHDEPWPSEQLSVTTLLSEPFDVAMSVNHPLAARSSVSAIELANEAWIAAHAGFAPDVALGVVEATAGVRFHRAHRVNDYHLAASLIVGGGLLALFPRYTAPRADPRLVLVPLEDVRIARNIDVLARPHALARVAVAGTLERLQDGADALQQSRPVASAVGPGLHHVEVWLASIETERASWAWLLSRVGYTMTSEWPGGETWEAGDTYLTLTESPNLSAASHDRRRPGVNHLAFRGGTQEAVDSLMTAGPEHGWRQLYQERYPHAGGDEHYAGRLENEAGFKVEVVAEAAVSDSRAAGA